MSVTVHPQWVAKMYPGKVGLDHLGLGSVSSDQILPTLSHGINVLTVHPRYYSFYSFLLDEFWQRDRPRSHSAYMRFYRPREFIFSVGAYLCDRPEHGEMRTVVGGEKTGPLAARRLDAYDTTFYYIKSDLGGYGLYYRTAMAEMGLIYPGGPGFPYPVDVPTQKGRDVAAAFRQTVQDTAYYRQYFNDDDTHVPIAVIQEYIARACLCQLQLPTATDRPILLDVFLHGGTEQAAKSRRATFRLLLDLAVQTDGYAVSQNVFRQLLFFQASDTGAVYHPRDTVQDAYHRWRMYQAREYYAFALNALWYHLCGWGIAENGDLRPIPLSRFHQYLDASLNFDNLAARLGVPKPGLSANDDFQKLLGWLRGLVGANETDFDLACQQNAPIQEHRLYRLASAERSSPDVMVAGMMVILALIYLRFGVPDCWLKQEWVISRMGADGRLSLDGFVKAVRRWLQSRGFTIGDFARWICADYVILQHQLVATGKLPENTFRFQREEGDRLRFYRLDNSLSFMDSRFDALNTTVYELGFCGNFLVPAHPLTADGQRFLAEGDLP